MTNSHGFFGTGPDLWVGYFTSAAHVKLAVAMVRALTTAAAK